MMSTPKHPAELSDIFTSPAAYADPETWHEKAAWLRQESPVHLVDVSGYPRFFAITRHADVMAIERRTDVFHNTDRNVLQREKVFEAQTQLGPATKNLVSMDGHEHALHRAATADWFRPAAVRRLTDEVAGRARAAVRALAGFDGECDFVQDLALRYPLGVIMHILGVPTEDEPLMLRLTQELFGVEDPEFARGTEVADTVAVIKDFYRYCWTIVDARRRTPTDDLASVLARAEVDGEPMGRLETASYFLLIATAGHDTTSNAIAGGLDALLDHPEQLGRLRAEPDLLVTAADEIVRWVSPVKHFMRTAQEDVEVNGYGFECGDLVLLSYASANRDDAVFADPFSFDVGRANASAHLAYGFGAHFCLGAHLARLEIRELFRALLDGVEHIERAGPTEYTRTTFVGGPKHLPVRFQLTPTATAAGQLAAPARPGIT